MKHGGGQYAVVMLGIVILLFCSSQTVLADETSPVDSTILNQSLEMKKQSIDIIGKQIDAYKQKISEKEAEATTLANQLDILENRLGKTQAEMDAAQLESEVVQTEIDSTQTQLTAIESQLDRKRSSMIRVLEGIQSQDARFPLHVFYSTKNFSELFNSVEQLQQINADLKKNVDETKRLKLEKTEKQSAQLAKREQLTVLQKTLEQNKRRLAEETEAKLLLAADVHASESRFQKLLTDLKQEQSFVQDQVRQLQSQLEQKIKPEDAINGGLLSWPFDPGMRGVNVLFHDPTYPFRNLFEHSGLDMPAPTGTAVRSAAAGYVAWTRKGTQYGNYVMVIHSNGLATLYAHLSRIDVVTDQFLKRGDQIGAVGMTGFATGPHLHFEVRKEGIPTDPIPFLPSI